MTNKRISGETLSDSDLAQAMLAWVRSLDGSRSITIYRSKFKISYERAKKILGALVLSGKAVTVECGRNRLYGLPTVKPVLPSWTDSWKPLRKVDALTRDRLDAIARDRELYPSKHL